MLHPIYFYIVNTEARKLGKFRLFFAFKNLIKPFYLIKFICRKRNPCPTDPNTYSNAIEWMQSVCVCVCLLFLTPFLVFFFQRLFLPFPRCQGGLKIPPSEVSKQVEMLVAWMKQSFKNSNLARILFRKYFFPLSISPPA